MEFVADLHVHSHYSIATSKDCTPDMLALYAKKKGIRLLATGDCTHPGWRAELRERLSPVGGGLYALKDPAPDLEGIRFVVSGEISSIYKKGGRTRKVHSLVLLPSIEDADHLAEKLERIGNIRADGRPILGLDARELLAMSLDIAAEAIFIPAHIWTPHFSVLGSASGFDSLEECFDDLAGELAAVETGLSSDPPMNWRLSSLDRFTLVSNSDAHSPRNLAREANRFDCELSYSGLRNALIRREGCLGTIEFYAEEGKYHLDGHRQCGVSLSPAETIQLDGICPVCGRKLTVGVLHRAERLADLPAGHRPAGAPDFERLVPLHTLIASALGMGEGSRAVLKAYDDALRVAGSELAVLREVPVEDLKRTLGPLVAEAVRRGRTGELRIAAGFDGQYGRIDVFEPDERDHLARQAALFDAGHEMAPAKEGQSKWHVKETPAPNGYSEAERALPGGLTQAQRRAVEAGDGPVIIVAGPGSGKTSTLIGRIEYLLGVRGVDPRTITAVTFTRKAAGELRERIERRLGDCAGRLHVGTFHQLALEILRHHYGSEMPRLLGEDESRRIVGEVLPGAEQSRIESEKRRISLLKTAGILPGGDDVFSAYQERLAIEKAMDYDDILVFALALIRSDVPAWQRLRDRYTHLLVDEFQDVNEVQYGFVTESPPDLRNLFVIGDPDQAIYAFRGADSRLFDRLLRDHPGGCMVSLNDNFRSAATIVAGAAALILHNSGAHCPMKSARGGLGMLRHISVSDERQEAREVAQSINRLVGGTDMLSAHGRRANGDPGGGFSFADIAVLFRTGRQVEALEEQFVHDGLPYRVIGRESFLEHPAVAELIAWMRCVEQPGEPARLQALFQRSAFAGYCGPLSESQAFCGNREETVGLESLQVQAVHERANRLGSVAAELDEMRRQSAHASIQSVALDWATRRGEAETAAIQCFVRLAAGYPSLTDLLQQIDAGSEGDFERQGFVHNGAEAISLMTMHASKGLEFPVVFIVGSEEGLLPMGDVPDGDSVEEERRLFYVGMTRAIQELIFVSCRHRFRGGEMQGRRVSRFIREIPPDLIVSAVRRGRPEGRQLKLFGFSDPKRAVEE